MASAMVCGLVGMLRGPRFQQRDNMLLVHPLLNDRLAIIMEPRGHHATIAVKLSFLDPHNLES